MWKLCSSMFEVRIASKCKKCLLASVRNWSFCFLSENVKIEIT